MRHVRKWENGEMSEPRPLCFCGEPEPQRRPSSFPFRSMHIAPGGRLNRARIYYRLGWTAVVFWNSEAFFTEEIRTFDGMMELIRERFPEKFFLQAPIEREYVEVDECANG
jgi:hypothetical protein